MSDKFAKFSDAVNGVLTTWHRPIYALSAFVLGVTIAWHVLHLATPLPSYQIALLVMAMTGLAIGLWIKGGEIRLLNVLSSLATYAGGFAAALAAYDAIENPEKPIAEWQVWLIFTAVFILVYRAVLTYYGPRRRLELMEPEERAEYLAARLAETRRKTALKSLPSNGWYQIASFVTGAAMIGSFATTAIGFYHEIVDPLDPPLVQYGIPIGLSALAALIIWAGWNFVFLRIRLAGNIVSRLFGYIVGLVVLVPMTLAIHTVFGIIGVGGTEGLRAHNLWYADVLDAYERRVDGIRAIEANRLSGALQYMSNQLKAAAASEEATGQGCGAGKGSLWTFYTDSAARTQTIVDIVTTRKNANQDIKSEIEMLRARIRKPEGKLEDIQPDLAARADQVRKKIMETDNSSALPPVKTFVKETRATVNSEAFFSGWSDCTLTKKDVILTQINTLLTSVEEAATSAETDIAAKKSSPEFRIPVENRIETIPFIDRYFHGDRSEAEASLRPQDSADVPVFVPLRPFWAVVSYAGSLMGYIALQLALDFSPAVLGILFALLAPFPDRKTRLGRAWDDYWEKRLGGRPDQQDTVVASEVSETPAATRPKATEEEPAEVEDWLAEAEQQLAEERPDNRPAHAERQDPTFDDQGKPTDDGRRDELKPY